MVFFSFLEQLEQQQQTWMDEPESIESIFVVKKIRLFGRKWRLKEILYYREKQKRKNFAIQFIKLL